MSNDEIKAELRALETENTDLRARFAEEIAAHDETARMLDAETGELRRAVAEINDLRAQLADAERERDEARERLARVHGAATVSCVGCAAGEPLVDGAHRGGGNRPWSRNCAVPGWLRAALHDDDGAPGPACAHDYHPATQCPECDADERVRAAAMRRAKVDRAALDVDGGGDG